MSRENGMTFSASQPCGRGSWRKTLPKDLTATNVICIGCLAVAEGLFRRSEMPLLGEVWDYYNCVDVLYVVVGQQPRTSKAQDGTGVQRTYRVDESQDWALVWLADRRVEEMMGGEKKSVVA